MRIVRIASGTGSEVSEFSGDGFAEDERARIFKKCYRLCLLTFKNFGRQFAAPTRGETIDVKNIFDSDGDAEERRARFGGRVFLRSDSASRRKRSKRFGSGMYAKTDGSRDSKYVCS